MGISVDLTNKNKDSTMPLGGFYFNDSYDHDFHLLAKHYTD